jgi:hypothetical protein
MLGNGREERERAKKITVGVALTHPARQSPPDILWNDHYGSSTNGKVRGAATQNRVFTFC